MKKIIPFKKEIKLEDDFNELVSIALEHTFEKKENMVLGNFIINGEYNKDKPFNYTLPFQINLDEKYDLRDIDVIIDDFYYEINDKTLLVNIEVCIDNLNRCVEEELNPIELDNKDLEVIEENKYTTYKVYIVLENDTIEGICTKYNILKEELEKYNDLENIKTKDKIIIPYIFNENIK